MKNKNRSIIINILVFALVVTLAMTRRSRPFATNPQTETNFKFSNNPKKCLHQANAEIKSRENKCKDLRGVILTRNVGAIENYINGCLAELVNLQ